MTNVTPIPDVIHESMSRPSSCRMRLCSPAVRSRTSAGDTIWPRGYNLSRTVVARMPLYNTSVQCDCCWSIPIQHIDHLPPLSQTTCQFVYSCSPVFTNVQHTRATLVQSVCQQLLCRTDVESNSDKLSSSHL